MQTSKKISFTLILSMAVIFIAGCLKKGKDDPFISLHSRDARLANEWKLISADETSTSTYNGNTTTGTITVSNGFLFGNRVYETRKDKGENCFEEIIR